ncbi:thiamine phosphate synthase [Granulicella arctica]|uniref:Thiamine-phosphate synthase n=1 Tax=Granulicella arctica TaxID=940613 RepID=A0A7Y9TLN5_9BACT|nr:thiamine-phosphate pyrophosphorylase [Granulicella arctica]
MLYPILDAGLLEARGVALTHYVEAMHAAGVTLLQYRDKAAGPQAVLRNAAAIREALNGANCRLILNDRSDLAVLAGWDGVHVGQGDLPTEDARRVVGTTRWVGVSTHTDEQVRLANTSTADYIAIGPVFATGTKLDAEPVVGLEGVRRARALTARPLVAIGGITRENARSVIEAGADSVAVISALFISGEPIEKVARDFLQILR